MVLHRNLELASKFSTAADERAYFKERYLKYIYFQMRVKITFLLEKK